MKFITFLFIALTVLTVVRAEFIIDSFSGYGTLVCNPSFYFGGYGDPDLSSYVIHGNDSITGQPYIAYPDLYCSRNFNRLGDVFGGTRRIVIHTRTEQLEYAPESLAAVGVNQGNLVQNTGDDFYSTAYLNYAGPSVPNSTFDQPILDPSQINIGSLLPTSSDITENGANQAFRFTFVSSSTLGVVSIVAYTTENQYSQRIIRTASLYNDSSNYGRDYVIPFNSFSRAAGASASADFTQIRGISLQLTAQNFGTQNMILTDFRAVAVPSTPSAIPPTPSSTPSSSTIPPTPSAIPPTSTPSSSTIPSTPSAIPPTPSAIPPTPSASTIPPTPSAIPPTPSSTPSAIPPTSSTLPSSSSTSASYTPTPSTCNTTPTPSPSSSSSSCPPPPCNSNSSDDDDGVTINFYFADMLRGL